MVLIFDMNNMLVSFSCYNFLKKCFVVEFSVSSMKCLKVFSCFSLGFGER